MNTNHFSIPAPPAPGQAHTWSGLHGIADVLAVCELARCNPGLHLIITRDSARATRWQNAIAFFAPELASLQFPDWETLAYDAFSPHQDIVSERLATLRALSNEPTGFLTVPITTLLQRLPPYTFLAGTTFDFRTGQSFDVEQQRQLLNASGYQHTDTVTERGHYAVRGAVMDIFPMGAELPIRIDLFDDEIDTLRTFDPETQRTVEQIKQMQLLPAREFPFDKQAVARFRDAWHHTFNVDVRRCSVYQDVSSQLLPNGIEYYLPFFFEQLGCLFDYLGNGVTIIAEAGVFESAQTQLDDIQARYESLRHDVERPILPPLDLYLSVDELRGRLHPYARVVLSPTPGKHGVDFGTAALPDLELNPRSAQPATNLKQFTAAQTQPILFVAESPGRREMFDELLRKAGIHTSIIASFAEFQHAAGHCITTAALDEGLHVPTLALVTETEVLGTRQVDPRREPGPRSVDPELIIRNLTELNVGAPVVHMEHGVGRYLGLQTLHLDGSDHEFLTLGYADEDKLYVPVTALHLISRYAGADEAHAPLHRLGSDQWEKAKRRAAEKVVDVAAELLDIYARRELRTSHQYKLNESDYRTFASEFPYAVTLDQQAAIDDTLADMTALRAMDRLVCGDVGFGKTEVAMRAAFVAVQDGKQVAVLVPTTLLAQQHADSFRERFAAWPVRIDSVSRLRTEAELSTTAAQVASGQVDILIGTHKLLGSDFRFKDLGLIIVDEEHRFGVRQKERLKSLRAEVDILTLTATPIPRTLNMSLSGIRDLSIIATPPAKRLSIKTFVQQKQRHLVREAISRELLRGGQVFYLHNEVRSIARAADEIVALVPEARIGIGHGQMVKRDLEQVMSDFYHRRINVLVCTTIIETGLDIPNANTIIIERADKFGLAQLHQLRGRVGRSHRQAYAFLLTPEPAAMTRDALKRLDAIEAAGDLGVGFTLATHDMEIRGAGELLGEDQSGQIESVGFSLYMDLLNRAVAALRAGKVPNVDSPLEPISQEVNLHAPTLIPEDYLPDVHARLILYKRISSAQSQQQLDDLQVEIIDRFGLLPPPLKRLFAVTGLKLTAQATGIVKLDMGDTRGKLEFSQDTLADPMTIVKLVQTQPNTYKLEGASVLRITHNNDDFEERLAFCKSLLESLTPAGECIA